MIISEKNLREKLSVDYMLPLVSLFFSHFIFSDNGWLAALAFILLVPVYLKLKLNGSVFFTYGISLIIISALLSDNAFAVDAYWLLATGTLNLLVRLYTKRG